ncbi:MAG: hypothetical protein FWD49_00170 [Firmicutes bacterium]|nr:hypothetical protein [Bacillota bacterium]
MNIIRTTAIELSSIPAIAYKLKIKTGGAGVKIHRLDTPDIATFTVDKRTGTLVPYGKVILEVFPLNAQAEAVSLTAGLPYSSRGMVSKPVVSVAKATVAEVSEPEPELVAEEITCEEDERVCMAFSPEYLAIIKEYSDINSGKLSFQRMNKEFIQFASKSKVVDKLIADKTAVDEIVKFVVKNRAENLSKNKIGISDKELGALMEILDDICVRSAFKELNAHLKRMLKK